MTIRELEQLMLQYGKDILSFCIHLSGNVADGEELYQEVFLKALDKLPAIHVEENPKSYLLGIAVKIFYSEKRKVTRRNNIVPITDYNGFSDDMTVPYEDNNDIEVCIIKQEEKELVRKSVHELPSKYKAVILLFYMEELTLEEISKLLKIPKGTVASRLHKAKEILKNRLEDYYEYKY